MSSSDRRAVWELAAASAERHSWYAALSGGAGGQCEVPLLTRELCDAHVYGVGLKPEPDEVAFLTSGAASGLHREVLWSRRELAANDWFKRQLFSCHLAGTRKVAIDVGLGLASHSAGSVFESLGLDCLHLPFDLPLDEHLTRLEEFSPDALYSMPSLVDSLLGAGADPRAWGLRKLILVGEPCGEAWISQASQRCGIDVSDVLDTYGSVEVGLIAYRCLDCGRYHLLADILAETVMPSAIDETWSDGALGPEEGILVVSRGFREKMPVVRFVTYDVVRGFGRDSCGDSLRLGFDALLGRCGDEVKHGERISLYDIERAILRVAPGVRYQVVLSKTGRIRIDVLGGKIGSTTLTAIQDAVSQGTSTVGAMMSGGLLEPIEVTAVDRHLPTGVSPKQRVVRRE